MFRQLVSAYACARFGCCYFGLRLANTPLLAIEQGQRNTQSYIKRIFLTGLKSVIQQFDVHVGDSLRLGQDQTCRGGAEPASPLN